MAKNFQVLVHRNSDNLHVKLLGDFDVSSALELMNALERYGVRAFNVYIHTAGLEEVNSQGREMLQANLPRLHKRLTGTIIFTGENADKIAPEQSHCV